MNKLIYTFLGILIILDIILFNLNFNFLLIPTGLAYIILLSYFLTIYQPSYFHNTKWPAYFLTALLVFQIVIAISDFKDLSYDGGKVLIRNLHPRYVTGMIISVLLILVSFNFNNKKISSLVVLLSIFWFLSEPVTMYQLELPAMERTGVYRYPIITPINDLLFYALMFFGFLSIYIIPITFVIGIWYLVYKKSLFLERSSILLSILLFMFYSANWGVLHFDI